MIRHRVTGYSALITDAIDGINLRLETMRIATNNMRKSLEEIMNLQQQVYHTCENFNGCAKIFREQVNGMDNTHVQHAILYRYNFTSILGNVMESPMDDMLDSIYTGCAKLNSSTFALDEMASTFNDTLSAVAGRSSIIAEYSKKLELVGQKIGFIYRFTKEGLPVNFPPQFLENRAFMPVKNFVRELLMTFYDKEDLTDMTCQPGNTAGRNPKTTKKLIDGLVLKTIIGKYME
jgi:hypothetical protein